MATHERPANLVQIHTTQLRHDQGGARSLILSQGPSKGKILTVMALLPVGGILLGLAGITLAGTMIGLALATPVFVILSPVIIPAALTVGLAVAGFLTSGTFWLTGLSSLSFLVNCVRQATGRLPEKMENVKGRMQDMAVFTGKKTKEVGQKIKNKAHEVGPEGQGQSQSQSQGSGKLEK
ncbi:oleosin 16.4 kDa-like [Cynara cardunculus var. scolymus]|uniref:oleosin 16.4 kDa-like n=1 Tax=Cynara cardunculus var. scolymus TaxID=59895 RepID=UPI000D6304C0|nr:oleosin 16.4 kDa-like [Cynara cardunculus var. scolymus]